MPRPSSLATKVRFANPTDVKDLDDPSLGTAGSRQIGISDEHGQFRNALASRGGIVHDGSTNSRAVATLTNQTIGTDPFSVSIILKVPPALASTSQGIFGLGPSATDFTSGANYAFSASLESVNGGRLTVTKGHPGAYIGAAVYNVITLWGGKFIHLVVTHDGSSAAPLVYINAVLQTTTAVYSVGGAAWTDTVASSYFGLGAQDSSSATRLANCPVSATSVYNLALSASDVAEIFELGGAVPERFKWGSQIARLADSASDGVFTNPTTHWSSWGVNVTVSVDTTNQCLVLTAPATGVGGRLTGSTQYTPALAGNGGRLRIRGTVAGLAAGQTIQWGFVYDGGLLSGLVDSAALGNGSFDVIVEINPSGWPGFQIGGTAGAVSITLDNFSVTRVGAVVHLPCDDGAGLLLKDASSNKLDAVMTSTGVTHIISRRRAVIRTTLTFSASGNLQVLGQAAIDTSRRWRITSVGGNSSAAVNLSLGSASGGAQYVSAQAVPAGDFDIATFVTHLISGPNLWVNASAATTLTLVVNLEALD